MEGVNVLPSMYSWAMYPSPPRRLEPSPPLQANLTLESEELGAGNFGTVYKAKYNFLKCAVKVLHPNFQNPGLRETIRQECALLSSLQHPNIVLFIDVQDYVAQSATTGQQPLVTLIMELMDESLTEFLKRHKPQGSIPLHSVVDISHDVLLGVHYLHSKGITYSNLSSNNVLLLKGRAKISEIGVSRIGGVSSIESSYKAPELRLNQCTPKSDVFSFGVLLIQMVTLRPPRPNFILTHDRSSGSLTMAKEIDRRQKDVAGIPKKHKLKATALLCISDSQEERPSSGNLCNEFEELKKSREYKRSIRNQCSPESLSSDSTNSSDSTESSSDSSESETESD